MLSLIRTLIPLGISMAVAVFLALAMSELPADQIKHLGSAPWGPFFSVFGMIYAIIAGFLMVNVLGRHSNLSSTFEGELNAVEDLRDFLIYVDDQTTAKTKIKESLQAYIRSVSEQEWPAMIKGASINSDTTPELYEVMRAVDLLEVNNESDRIALRSLIEKVSDLTTLRTRRIALANEKLPPRLKLLLGFMSTVLVGGLILIGAGHMMVHVAMVASITVSVHLLYLIIADLNQPFSGVWNLDKTPLEEIQKDFQGDRQ